MPTEDWIQENYPTVHKVIDSLFMRMLYDPDEFSTVTALAESYAKVGKDLGKNYLSEEEIQVSLNLLRYIGLAEVKQDVYTLTPKGILFYWRLQGRQCPFEDLVLSA